MAGGRINATAGLNPPDAWATLASLLVTETIVETILDRIVTDKRREVAEAKNRIPLAQLRDRAALASPPRDSYVAITPQTETGINLIAEIQRRSPSAGPIRQDFDPAAIS